MHHQTLVLPVLGAQSDARVYGRPRGLKRHGLAVELYLASCYLVGPEQSAGDFSAPRADKAREPQNLAAAQLKAHVSQNQRVEVVDLEDDVSDVFVPAQFRVCIADVPPHHRLYKLGFRGLRRVEGLYQLPVF